MIWIKTKFTGPLAKNKYKDIIHKEMDDAMDLAVQLVEGEVAVQALKKGLKGVTGQLIQGIHGKKITHEYGKVFIQGPAGVYGEVMELGRKPGSRMPPPAALIRWVYLKLQPDIETKWELRKIARALAISIKVKGIKGRKFFQAAERKMKRQLPKFYKDVIRRIENKLSDK